MNQLVKPFRGRGLGLFLAMLLVATVVPQTLNVIPASADDGGYPWVSATYVDANDDWGYINPPSGCPGSDTNCGAMVVSGYGTADPWGYTLRNCTSFVAWKVNQIFNVTNISGWGNGDTWDTGYLNSQTYPVYSPSNYTPQVGDIAQWGDGPGRPLGHVAYVYAVNNGIASLDEYNVANTGAFTSNRTTASNSAGTPDHYIHIGTDTTTNNTIIDVKKITQSDGTNEVVWAKNTDVDETWWRGNSGPQIGNLIHISQGDIVGFDINLYSNGEHDLFTATAHNIWETWWYPGQGLHTAEVLPNIGNIHKIIKSVGPRWRNSTVVRADRYRCV